MFVDDWATFIRQERTVKGWSQEYMARFLGVSTHTVWRWEKGLSVPALTRRVNYAKDLGDDT